MTVEQETDAEEFDLKDSLRIGFTLILLDNLAGGFD